MGHARPRRHLRLIGVDRDRTLPHIPGPGAQVDIYRPGSHGSAQARTSRLEPAARPTRQPVQSGPAGEARRRTRHRPGRANPDEIRRSLRRLLEHREYRDRAGEIAAEIASLPPIDHAAELIEQLAMPAD